LREDNNQWTPVNSVYTSFTLDDRDLYYDPSNGYYAVERLGWFGILPMEREKYIRSDTKAEWYYTLWNWQIFDNWAFKGVFAIHTGVTFLLPQPNHAEAIVENDNKLAIDGMFIARGWTDEYMNKGMALWENWAEIRQPLVPNILAWDWFFDAAAVKDTIAHFFNDFSIEDMKFSFGGGLRFCIPQFPFRFLFAKRFDVEDGQIVLKHGPLFGKWAMDFVISFAMSTY
jgi:outer membrane protein insertion porin family